MDKVTALLNRKVAGIPVYVVALILAAAVLWWAIRLRPTEDVTDPEPSANDSEDTGTDFGDGEQPVFTATPPATVGSVTSTNSDDNAAWGQRAISFLVANGSNASEAGIAINKYLDGDTLTYNQGQLRDKAVAQLGLPPEPLTPGRVKGYAGPASAQGTPPTSHTVMGKSDDSPGELARLYYGMNTADAVRLIRAANSHMVEPYKVGAVVRVPKFHRPQYVRATRHMRTLYELAAKNSTSPDQILMLNPGLEAKDFPVKIGRKIRVS
jgi:hypothetical protein